MTDNPPLSRDELGSLAPYKTDKKEATDDNLVIFKKKTLWQRVKEFFHD